MTYALLALLCLGLLAVALYYFLRAGELTTRIQGMEQEWRVKEDAYVSELNKLEKIRHIPDIIERARRSKADIEAKLAEASKRADEILHQVMEDARSSSRSLTGEAEALRSEAQEALRVAKWRAQNALEEAQREAKDLASKARKDAKEKRERADSALIQATTYALEIRRKAERRAEEIAGEAYEAKGKLRDYEATAQAYRNRIEKYQGIYVVPAAHALDELAEVYGYEKAGTRLQTARERTRLMRANGTAATCDYSDGWKREHALKFVLSTFDGKVDTILSRLKTNNQGKLIQEIKDAYALVNADGEVYKDARIQEEYLDSRLEEVKWGVAVLKMKEAAREEQRAMREQIREEQRAKREIDRAIKQAEREEELVNRALAKLRRQLEEASDAEKSGLESQLLEMQGKLAEAEEKGRRAMSMAQQTKKGHVYVISNLGSFGEGVYKVGLTRRLDPNERVYELGGASVPFPFDVHAMLKSDDAPALEAALHRRFVEMQLNKVNRRKEFFRLDLADIKEVIDELGIECTWTMSCEASQYRQTLALEKAMQSNVELKKQWLEEQTTFRFDEEDFNDSERELEESEV